MTLSTPSQLDTFFSSQEDVLIALVDEVVPRDDFPSAADAGALVFLRQVVAERLEWLDRLVDLAATHPDASSSEHWAWFAELVAGGYYADPTNGGNDDAESWRMVNWRPDPPQGWSTPLPVAEARPFTIQPADVAARYDAIVIGSGAGGGVAACGLAEAGRRVLVIEAGSWPSIAALSRDHIRNPRSDWGLAPLTGPSDAGNPRVRVDGRTSLSLRPSDMAWNNNAATAGGGTRVYGAQAWRFAPQDFEMASTYGVPAGSSLADWPITYDDLEPFYERAEWEVGVSGGPTDGAWAGTRRRPLPMGPVQSGPTRDLLAAGADALGYGTVHVPLLINSRPYLGRRACESCGLCVGFACPVDAKNGSQNTLLSRAFATGNAEILLETNVSRLRTDATGRVIGVTLVGRHNGQPWHRDVDASEIVIAAGAVESARLLLNSRSNHEPDGIGNNTDQVGRHLQGHFYGGAIALFDDVVDDGIGPGPSIATTDFRHGNTGFVGGAMLANEFVATPSNTYRYLTGVGLLPRAGLESKQGMRDLVRRTLRIMGPVQEVTSATSRVRVDPSVTDRNGIPVARFSGSIHSEDVRMRDHFSARAGDWLRASGAKTVVEYRGPATGTSGGQHQAGTLRMGNDPATSAVDPYGRIWGHDNVRVADGSVHVTNGGVNPVLTIFATALRTIDDMIGGWRPQESR